MTDEKLKQSFARDVVLLKLVGMDPVVVHGGGPQIDELLKRVGKKGEFVQGMRVTDAETMDVVEMVLGGLVNKEIVNLINQHGGRAIGLTGKDGSFIRARKMLRRRTRTMRPRCSTSARSARSRASIPRSFRCSRRASSSRWWRRSAWARTATSYNINADLVAGKLAEILHAEKLILLTNTPGVLDKNGKLLTGLTPKQVEELFADGTIHGGMLPKIGSALDAAKSGVKSVHIIDGRVEHALLLEVLTDQGVGTLIRNR